MTALPQTETALDFARFPARLRELAPIALRAFRDIADHWRLTRLERRVLLGVLPESTYGKYMRHPETATLSFDTLQRISHLYGIFKALNILIPDERLADAWIDQPNAHPLFKGRTAKDVMLDGTIESIAAVRAYLDAERGW